MNYQVFSMKVVAIAGVAVSGFKWKSTDIYTFNINIFTDVDHDMGDAFLNGPSKFLPVIENDEEWKL